MADLQNLSVSQGSNVNVNVQQFIVEVKVVDSGDPEIVIADFTGANAITWPNVLGTLTGAQRRALLAGLLRRIVRVKAGLDSGLDEQ